MLKTLLLAAAAAGALAASPAAAQDHDHHRTETPAPAPAPDPGQDHSQHGDMGDDIDMPMKPHATPAIAWGSGTSRLPRLDGGGHGQHLMAGDWMVMAHGYVTAVYTDQSGPRGDDMPFVQSMAMLSAERDLGGAQLQLRTMLSAEPAMGPRGYPNLFATGEVANGQPLIDRQHPHDLFMELAARVDFNVGGGKLFVYGGPVAEPALGPSAFMHRRSARYLPLAPITHHWFDSTHITYGVVTLGYAASGFQIEGSAFRGREPDERRWNIETPALDSWSVRASFEPSASWLLQASYGRLESPEEQHPGADEGRATASVQYASRDVSALLAFSAKDRIPGDVRTAWLGEINWDISAEHRLFGRIENVANDELFPDHSHPLHDRSFRVTKFEGGYAYRLQLTGNMDLALGGTVITYAKPAALDPYYGDPFGYTLFARLSLGD